MVRIFDRKITDKLQCDSDNIYDNQKSNERIADPAGSIPFVQLEDF